jgi:hypothetical protein
MGRAESDTSVLIAVSAALPWRAAVMALPLNVIARSR